MQNEVINWVRKDANEGLVRELFWQAGQYFTPLGSLVHLWFALEKASSHAERVEFARSFLNVGKTVEWKDADGFSVLIDGFRQWVERNPLGLPKNELAEIVDAAIEAAECSSENICDGDSWEMGVEELHELHENLV
jgi:hypothetical protein